MQERLWSKGNISALLVGMHAGAVSLDICMTISQKIRKQPSSRSGNTTLGIYPKDMCLTMFIAALFVITRTWKQSNTPQPKMDNNNVVYLHNGILHSRENNGILKFAGKWMVLENIILSEVIQTHKDNYHMYSFISVFCFLFVCLFCFFRDRVSLQFWSSTRNQLVQNRLTSASQRSTCLYLMSGF